MPPAEGGDGVASDQASPMADADFGLRLGQGAVLFPATKLSGKDRLAQAAQTAWRRG